MDLKQATDTIAFLTERMNHLEDLHQSDFMYFSQWLQELEKKSRNFEAVALKFEKTQQFADNMKAAAPVVVQVQKLPKFKIALAIGLGVAVGIKTNEFLTGVLYDKPKKEQ